MDITLAFDGLESTGSYAADLAMTITDPSGTCIAFGRGGTVRPAAAPALAATLPFGPVHGNPAPAPPTLHRST